MKKLFCIQITFTIAMVILALFLGSCVEEVVNPVEEKKEKKEKPDTTTHKGGPPPVFSHADTTKCKVLKPKCPTCEPQIIVEIDSVFITQTVTVTETDTVYIDHYIHVYTDTLVWLSYMRNTWSVPDEIFPFYDAFNGYTSERGIETAGGPLIVSYVAASELPGDGWNSTSYWFGGQQIILLNGEINPDHLYTPMLRELAKLQMNKKYTRDGMIMDPIFPADKIKLDSPDKQFYIDQLFGPLSI